MIYWPSKVGAQGMCSHVCAGKKKCGNIVPIILTYSVLSLKPGGNQAAEKSPKERQEG
jgi:hypothetical protein